MNYEDKADRSYMLEIICTSNEDFPQEVRTRLVGYLYDFFVSTLFLTKHLPNGPMGPLVNSAISVIRDLRAYLYIADDPISEEYSIDTLVFGRDDETNELKLIQVYMGRTNTYLLQEPDDEQVEVDTGFRDKHGDIIMSCNFVRYIDQVFMVIHNPHIKQWVLDNKDGQVRLIDVYKYVELTQLEDND